jgi:hypothetical protein
MAGGVTNVLVSLACESRGSAAAAASEHRSEGVCSVAEAGHVCGGNRGRVLVWVERNELLHEFERGWSEGKGLQAACSSM